MADKPKKKFKDTGVGKFLLEKIPGALGGFANILPDNGVFGMVKNIVLSSQELTPEDKEMAMKLLEMDQAEMQEITKRWEADMASDNWMSKNVRPLTLMYLTLCTTLMIYIDAADVGFQVADHWVDLLKTLLVTVYVAYFGSRGYEKYTQIRNKARNN